ncbi:hypothetical protein CEY00_Acc03735 [Actinidia chinensis var. chinensis]|uniref:Uncharacterized protein n=1 Tax=Actinidia chinensis var. chinensis TaxID=1590841 RepID=A0A2R6RTL2_ACTCC|nr:hypothetical protein CEY00_Acc03735 [Actinidia chinensis var. chinensis]
MKSKLLFWINEIDGRFHDMVLLVKEWAKAHGINDPRSGSLNSYCLSLLIIFHFQTCVPALLPPLKEIYSGNLVDDLTVETVGPVVRCTGQCTPPLKCSIGFTTQGLIGLPIAGQCTEQ